MQRHSPLHHPRPAAGGLQRRDSIRERRLRARRARQPLVRLAPDECAAGRGAGAQRCGRADGIRRQRPPGVADAGGIRVGVWARERRQALRGPRRRIPGAAHAGLGAASAAEEGGTAGCGASVVRREHKADGCGR